MQEHVRVESVGDSGDELGEMGTDSGLVVHGYVSGGKRQKGLWTSPNTRWELKEIMFLKVYNLENV